MHTVDRWRVNIWLPVYGDASILSSCAVGRRLRITASACAAARPGLLTCWHRLCYEPLQMTRRERHLVPDVAGQGRHRRRSAWRGLTLLAIAGALLAAAPPASVNAAPSLSVAPNSGLVGSSATLTGSGWAFNTSPYELFWDVKGGTPLGSFLPSPNGTWTKDITIPKSGTLLNSARDHGRTERRHRLSRRDSSRITTALHRQYRGAAQAGQWQRCLEVAERLRGLERDDALAAEAVYAYGLALEMLGDVRRAAMQYQTALMIDRRNAKARRRLARLER
jgi:hypothetical protein